MMLPVISLSSFGAVGDGTADDTQAVLAAFSYGGVVDWGSGTYRVTSPIQVIKNSNVFWFSHGAKVVYEGPICQRSFRIQLEDNSFWFDGVLIFNCGMKAFDGLYVEQLGSNDRLFYARGLIVESVFRSSLDFAGGNGIFIRGSFHPITLDSSGVRNCLMAANTGIAGSQGIFGISISSNSFGAPGLVTLINPVVSVVKSEDPSYTKDQDAIRVFAAEDGPEKLPSKTILRIVGGVIEEVPGRLVKSQTDITTITGLTGRLSTGFIQNGVSVVGNPAIDLQVGGGLISDVTLSYKNFCHSCAVQFNGTKDSSNSGKNIAGGTVRGLHVYLENTPTMSRLVRFAPVKSKDFTVSVRDAQIISETPLVGTFLGGSTSNSVGNENLFVENCVGKLQTGFVEIVGSGNSNVFVTNSVNTNPTAVPIITGNTTFANLVSSGVIGAI